MAIRLVLRIRLMRWLAVAILAAMSLGFITACDPMTPLTFVNETQEKLHFYAKTDVQSALMGARSVPAGSSVEFPWINADYTTLRVAVTRGDGNWVFDHTYTRSELEKAKSRVTVSMLEPIAPPSDVKVVPSQGVPKPVLTSTGN